MKDAKSVIKEFLAKEDKEILQANIDRDAEKRKVSIIKSNLLQELANEMGIDLEK